jgi:hypothetical protein
MVFTNYFPIKRSFYSIYLIISLPCVLAAVYISLFPYHAFLLQYIICYCSSRQVISADKSCLCFIFPEPKARETTFISPYYLPGAVITILSYFKSIYHNSNKRFVRFHHFFFQHNIRINHGYYDVIAQRHSIGVRHIYRANVNILSVWFLKQQCLSIIISNQRNALSSFS